MAMQRQWPALPGADPEQLRIWAAQITRLLQSGDIATGADLDTLSAAAVSGPASAGNGNFPLFDGATGKLLKDSGFPLSASGNRWGVVPVVNQSDGGMEIGQYFDFHNSDGDTADFSFRVDSFSSAAGLTLTKAGGSAALMQTAGKQSAWVPASAMLPNPAAPSVGSLNVGGAQLPYLAFDPASNEFAFFSVASPKSWDAGTLTAEFIWAHPATTVNFGVEWGIGISAFADNTAFANVYVSTTVADTGGTTSNIYRSAETSAVNPGNAQAKQDLLAFLIFRNATGGSDTLAVDAFLLGVMVHYTTDAPNDA